MMLPLFPTRSTGFSSVLPRAQKTNTLPLACFTPRLVSRALQLHLRPLSASENGYRSSRCFVRQRASQVVFEIAENADFFTYGPRKEIRNIYAKCDAWLTCSTAEGFNLPALEAMSCGTPVVSTRAGWCADGIVDQINGRLADGDVNSIADCLEWVLNKPERDWVVLSEAAERTMTTSSLGRKAQTCSRRFSLVESHDCQPLWRVWCLIDVLQDRPNTIGRSAPAKLVAGREFVHITVRRRQVGLQIGRVACLRPQIVRIDLRVNIDKCAARRVGTETC